MYGKEFYFLITFIIYQSYTDLNVWFKENIISLTLDEFDINYPL